MKLTQTITCLILLCANSVFAQTENPIGSENKTNPIPATVEPAKEIKATDTEIPKNDSKDLYEDSETGQIFTKPGPNRKKIDYFKSTEKPETGIVIKTTDPHKAKLTLNGRIQFRGVTGSMQSPYSNGHSDFRPGIKSFYIRWTGFFVATLLAQGIHSMCLSIAGGLGRCLIP